MWDSTTIATSQIERCAGYLMSRRSGILTRLGLLAAGLSASPGLAQTLPEAAQRMGEQVLPLGEALIATAPWSGILGLPAIRVMGAISTQSWKMPDEGQSTLEVMDRWRADLAAAGFVPLFGCAAADCGGFDFRFAIPVLPEPEMHVDLGDFRYFAAQKPGAGGIEYRLLLISRAPGLIFAQVTSIAPAAQGSDQGTAEAAPLNQASAPEAPEQPVSTLSGTVLTELLARGGAALDDLIFAPGAGDLEPGDYASLQELGEWLLANPQVSVALVGHTDATGGLEGNIALSKQRAQSVRRWLLARFDLPGAQLGAEGVGYLAPRAPNDTPEGQAENRRVEVTVTSTR